jgi:PAS domain S-box-containing protein
MATDSPRIVALGLELEAARETIEVLIRRYEGAQGPLQTDQFAVRKAMAALENNVAVSTRALQTSEARLRTLFDHGPHMLLTVDREGLIRTANRRVARMLRLQASDLVGEPLDAILDESSTGLYQEMLERGFEGVVERVAVLSNGVQVALTAARLPGFEGETQLVLRDLTWRRLLEEELQHARRLALLGHLAAVVGHEINNPLAVMLGRLELMLQAPIEDSDRMREQLGRVLEHGRRIGRIVQDLQAVARPQPAKLERVQLVALLDEVCDLAEPFLGRAVMWVDVTPPSLHAFADAEQLRQAVLHLVSNAAERSRRTGRIVLKAERVEEGGLLLDSDGVVISVLDEGPPMPLDLLDDLLAPRSDGSVKRSGYPLGLAIAQNVVIEHGGTMMAGNRPEGGGAISMLLPSGLLPSGGPPAEPCGSGGLRLLYVDDDPLLVSLLDSMLEGTGCSWRLAATGEEALALLGHEEFDVLLVSIRLSGMSGVELRHAVAHRDPVLAGRTILIGGSPRSVPAGVPTLPRPFSRLQLLRCLEGVVGEP